MNPSLNALLLTDGKTLVKLDYKQIKKASLITRAVNHPLRYRIMKLLDENKRVHVSQIYAKLHVEQAVTSHHLAILRKADLVITERAGKFIFYSLNYAHINRVMNIVRTMAE